jgi:hypothetical protein
MSPKATIATRDHLVSSEKISVDIPVAQIIIPEARKKFDFINSKKSKE